MFTKKLNFTLGLLIFGIFIFNYPVLADKIEKGNNLKIAGLVAPATLSPIKARTFWDSVVLVDLFAGLFELDNHGNLRANLVDRWTLSEDMRTYTFFLRDDSYWSDGMPVIAKDFEVAYKLALNKENPSPYARFFYIIQGVEDYYRRDGAIEDIKVHAYDDKTLIITLAIPTNYFLYMLVNESFYPIPSHLYEKYQNDWSLPQYVVTNGSYMLLEWNKGRQIIMSKNPYYWDQSNVSIPYISYIIQNDPGALLKRFRKGEIDILQGHSADYINWIQNNLSDNYYHGPYLSTDFLVFNLDNYNVPELAEKNIRKALAMAIDREALAENILNKTVMPSYSIVPPDITGYTSIEFSWKSFSQEERTKMAQELLKEYGFDQSNPLMVEIIYNRSRDNRRVFNAIAQMWRKIGVRAVLKEASINTHYSNIEKNTFQIGRMGWYADYNQVSSCLQLYETSSVHNYLGFSNKSFDALMLKARTEEDLIIQNELYNQAEALLLEELFVIPLYVSNQRFLVANRVTNFNVNGIGITAKKFLQLKTSKANLNQ